MSISPRVKHISLFGVQGLFSWGLKRINDWPAFRLRTRSTQGLSDIAYNIYLIYFGSWMYIAWNFRIWRFRFSGRCPLYKKNLVLSCFWLEFWHPDKEIWKRIPPVGHPKLTLCPWYFDRLGPERHVHGMMLPARKLYKNSEPLLGSWGSLAAVAVARGNGRWLGGGLRFGLGLDRGNILGVVLRFVPAGAAPQTDATGRWVLDGQYSHTYVTLSSGNDTYRQMHWKLVRIGGFIGIWF